MDHLALLYPAFVLVFLTFGASLWLLKCRYRAMAEGLNPRYFQHNRGGKLPDYLVQATQHYSNLYELPVLFYAATAVAISADAVDNVLIFLAWGFVASRVMHTLIHLSHNGLIMRRNLFFVGFLFLLLMWVWLVIRVVSMT